MLVKDKGIALRGLFIINPQGVLEQSTINNLPIGRSVDEALRLLQAIQFTAEHGEVRSAVFSSWASLVDLLKLFLSSFHNFQSTVWICGYTVHLIWYCEMLHISKSLINKWTQLHATFS